MKARYVQATYSNRYDGVCGSIPGGLQLISMNAAQFGGGAACGQCVQAGYTGLIEASNTLVDATWCSRIALNL